MISGTDKSKALDYSLIGIFFICSFVMLFQSITLLFPLSIYVFSVILFITAIVFSIFFGKQLMALVGVFSFSVVIRLMYYTSTGFSVLPAGDPYGQYSVLLAFAQSSHVGIFHASNIYNFLTYIPRQYAEWPGFEAFSLTLSRITNLPLFWTALIVPFILYSIWFAVSYALLRRLFMKFTGSASTLSVLSIAIAAALPTFEMPLYFKYDFMAAIFLLALIMLLVHPLSTQILEKSFLFVILVLGIVVTHSLTALFLAMFLALIGTAIILQPFVPKLISWSKSTSITKRRFPFSFPNLILVVFTSVAVWWTFYSTFAKGYIIQHSHITFHSFSLSFLSFSRIQNSSAAGSLRSLTPSWLLRLLHFRDELLLGGLAIGVLVLILWPLAFKKRLPNTTILLSIAIVTFVTEAWQVLNFNDRAFLTFAPILAGIIIVPVAVIASRKANLGKICGILILVVFLFTIALGFWGSSYAPVFLYSNSASAYSFAEHPTNWQQVAGFMNYDSTNSSDLGPPCIVTNEVFVTSLAIPVQQLGITYPYTTIDTRIGCIAIIYDSLDHFNSSYNTEPYKPYYPATPSLPAFSNAIFSNTLNNASDLVFDGGNATIYYQFSKG